MINFEGPIVNLREKLMEVEKKRGQAAANEKNEPIESKGKSSSESSSSSQSIADIISIRNENRMAADSSIRSEEEAKEVLGDLMKSFSKSTGESINAHKKADPNTVMQFYPFE
ncbi:hypothetical protein [Limisalsivibrio acetivorans]|uniref:hypothetical protein n=1 Tax=Limisalsivibrio acetivorans TaxID=1304888 RepID=UPI0003B70B9F|nr:hypothetical protein [Limisalsivibrio acetivorans]